MYNTLPEYKFYCQKVLPLVYDESLSYYETLCQLKKYLNDVISSQNEVIKGFLNLLDWVDKQLEKYSKEQLQEWLDDGTLEKIINETLFDKLNEKVNQNTTEINIIKTNVNKIDKKINNVKIANVLDFGAKGDGITDDTIAIQTAIDSNNKIYFPPGTFLTKKITLKSNIEIVGNNTTLKLMDNQNTQLLAGYIVNNIKIRNITLDGNKENNLDTPIKTPSENDAGAVLYLSKGYNYLIENCNIINSVGNGIYVLAGEDIRILNNNFSKCNRLDQNSITISFTFAPWLPKEARKCIISGNIIKDNVNGIGWLTGGAIAINNRGNTIVKDNFIDNCTFGISLEYGGKNTIVENNMITNIKKSGIIAYFSDDKSEGFTALEDVKILNNSLINTCYDQTLINENNDGAIYIRDMQEVVISGNIIEDYKNIGISIFTSKNVNVDKNIIKNSNAKSAILLSAATNIIVSNNILTKIKDNIILRMGESIKLLNNKIVGFTNLGINITGSKYIFLVGNELNPLNNIITGAYYSISTSDNIYSNDNIFYNLGKINPRNVYTNSTIINNTNISRNDLYIDEKTNIKPDTTSNWRLGDVIYNSDIKADDFIKWKLVKNGENNVWVGLEKLTII